MTSTTLDDPYHALGLTRDATAAAIKTAYRKLVLKHHPDKVQDETQKQSAADVFHKIQSAWEKIGDEEKRARYDAKSHLESLRKDTERERQYGGGRADVRPSPFRSAAEACAYQAPRDADRGAYRTEEVRPQGAGYFGDYRSADRRDFDFQPERPRRTLTRDDQRAKLNRQNSKESERARQRDKVRQSTKATARDRDYKHSHSYFPEDSASDSDVYTRSPRTREDERRTQDRHSEKDRRRSDESSTRYTDSRPPKAYEEAKAYIDRSSRRQQPVEPARRPSPPRVSSRDNTEYIKDSSGRPVQFRRGSGRLKTSSRDDDDLPSRKSRREAERSSGEYDDHPRRPPGLSQVKSAPNEIHVPCDKPRAHSTQLTSEQMRDFIPGIKRAETMPQQSSWREETRSKPLRSSTLRQTQLSEDYESRTPAQPSYSASATRSPKAYADDFEKPTPDGYVIETREPSGRTVRESEAPREKNRSSSTRYAAPPLAPLNTRTTSYAYSPHGVEILPVRPKLSREGSSRGDSYLYGEIPTSASPRDRHAYSGSENARYSETRPDYKTSPAYSGRRTSDHRSSSYQRTNSFVSPVQVL